jgi:hypothetical protein
MTKGEERAALNPPDYDKIPIPKQIKPVPASGM